MSYQELKELLNFDAKLPKTGFAKHPLFFQEEYQAIADSSGLLILGFLLMAAGLVLVVIGLLTNSQTPLWFALACFTVFALFLVGYIHTLKSVRRKMQGPLDETMRTWVTQLIEQENLHAEKYPETKTELAYFVSKAYELRDAQVQVVMKKGAFAYMDC